MGWLFSHGLFSLAMVIYREFMVDEDEDEDDDDEDDDIDEVDCHADVAQRSVVAT